MKIGVAKVVDGHEISGVSSFSETTKAHGVSLSLRTWLHLAQADNGHRIQSVLQALSVCC